nr:cytochrome oxidase subunit III [Bacillota bacterium]
MTRFSQPSRGSRGAVAEGRLVVLPGGGHRDDPVARSQIAVGLLLAAMTMVFAALVSAYLVRMDLSDWRAAPLPPVLWVNTALLVAASAALEAALRPARAGDTRRLSTLLWVAGLATAAFIVGQLAAWFQMRAMGYGVAATPGASFFYLLTLVHGVHVLGGLVPWVRLLARLRSGREPEEPGGRARARDRDGDDGPAGVVPALRLCAVYWHFLLGVWIVLYLLMLLT